MHLHSETASLAGLTAPVFSKGVVPHDYTLCAEISTEYAAAKVAGRWRLHIETARVVRDLAGLGVRL